MSVVLIRDLFCDWPRCNRMFGGDANQELSHLRKLAKECGWTRVRVEWAKGLHATEDRCPRHPKITDKGEVKQ